MYDPTRTKTPQSSNYAVELPYQRDNPIINKLPVGIDNDQEYYEAIIKRQTKDDKSKGTPKIYASIPIGLM